MKNRPHTIEGPLLAVDAADPFAGQSELALDQLVTEVHRPKSDVAGVAGGLGFGGRALSAGGRARRSDAAVDARAGFISDFVERAVVVLRGDCPEGSVVGQAGLARAGRPGGSQRAGSRYAGGATAADGSHARGLFRLLPRGSRAGAERRQYLGHARVPRDGEHKIRIEPGDSAGRAAGGSRTGQARVATDRAGTERTRDDRPDQHAPAPHSRLPLPRPPAILATSTSIPSVRQHLRQSRSSSARIWRPRPREFRRSRRASSWPARNTIPTSNSWDATTSSGPTSSSVRRSG